MTVEELLKPRYKAVSDYPGILYELGTIIPFETGVCVGGDTFKYSQYPHLFKRLEWHQERPKEEMPKYVRWTNPGSKEVLFVKVEQWLSNSAGVYTAHDYDHAVYLFIHDLQPATEQEYLNYLKTKA